MKRFFLVSALLTFSSLSAFGASPAPEAANPSASPTANAADGLVSVTAKANTATPYQNQPVLYTVRVEVRTSISKASPNDITVANAIVEAKGGPDISDQIEHGQPVRIAEFRYIITPLQPGKVTIPPIVLQGTFPAANLATLADPSGSFAVSSGTKQSMEFFSTYGGQPFTVSSNATQLNVKPPAAAMDPWLPLTSLKVSEKIDTSQTIYVGEQVVRKITLTAVGAVGSQLPKTEAQQNHSDFSTYSGTPAMGEDIDKKTDTISGWRTDTYTLIAQRPGHLVLPAIKVSWWDILNNKAATTVLPERVLYVLPEPMAQMSNSSHANGRTGHKRTERAGLTWLRNIWASHHFVLLWGLAGVLSVALLFGAFWKLRSRPKIVPMWPRKLTIPTVHIRSGKSPIRATIDERLGQVRTPKELKDFIQAYAHRHCGTSRNAPLEHIFSTLPDSRTGRRKEAEMVIKEIGAALYAGETADMESLKKRSRFLMSALRRNVRNKGKIAKKLERLNPT